MHRFIFSLELYIFREGLRLSDSDDLPNPSVVSPCQYHDTASFNSLSAKLNWLGFSILHANVRSFKKNLEPLKILFSELNHPPHFIAITETKINKDTGLNFAPNMPGYSFAHSDTQYAAGGVVIYTKDNILLYMWYAMTFQKYWERLKAYG